MKGVLLIIDITKPEGSLIEPSIKAKLEQSSKQPKELKLEDIISKLERAAINRESMKQIKEEKLRSLSFEREEKVRRKQSFEEVTKKEQKDKLMAEYAEAQKRRETRFKELVCKLQEYHERINKTTAEVNSKRENYLATLRSKIAEKLGEYESQREKSKLERVQKLANYHTKVLKTVQEARAKEEKKKSAIITTMTKKQQEALERRLKHMQEVKALAEEVAEKVFGIQSFVFNSECNESK